MLLNCGVGEDSWESLGLQGDPTSPFWRRSVLGVLWKEWCSSWNSSTLATSCEELTHWKRPWCWERLRAGEGDNRGWDDWMASPTRWTWIWVNSRSWWWTGRPGMVQFMGLQRVGHDWATELNWWNDSKPRSHHMNSLIRKVILDARLHISSFALIVHILLLSSCFGNQKEGDSCSLFSVSVESWWILLPLSMPSKPLFWSQSTLPYSKQSKFLADILSSYTA